MTPLRHDFVMSMRFAFTLVALSLVSACSAPPLATTNSAPVVVPEVVLPAEVLNPDVRQETVHKTICVPGYTASVRPSTSYTNGVKLKLLKERGLPEEVAKDYELDHVVPLALGGHPRNTKNLMIQPWEGPEGAKAKDRLEVRLQKLVCAGKVPLETAQGDIYRDWHSAFRKYVQP